MNFFYKIFFVLIPLFTVAQIEYGFKTGINLNNSSDITIITQDFDTSFTKDDFQGYFIGGFISLEGAVFNLRTELQYSIIKNSNNLTQNKIELPVTLGYKILPFLSAFIGPSFQYVLDEKSNSLNLAKIEDNSTMGLTLGTRLHISKIELDLRYERGLNPMETKIINQNNLNIAKIDTRASVFSIGISYKINSN